MSFKSSTQLNQREFSVVARMAKGEEEGEEMKKWLLAIRHAHERAWYIAQCFLLTAHGRDINPDEFSAESFGRLWENSGQCLQAKTLDFNDIDLLEGFSGKIPKTADGKESKRFTMVGLWANTKYRKDFIDFLKAERIPPHLILLAFPVTRGKHDGMFNLKLTTDTY